MRPRRRADHEHQEQVALFQWANLQAGQQPLLNMLLAIPNGGDRHEFVGKRLKEEGVKAGFPDIGLLVPKHPFYGLFVEMKRQKKHGSSRISAAQAWWLSRLNHGGYKAVVCYGWEEARQVIEDYLKGGI